MRSDQAGLVRRSLLMAACAAVPARAYAQGRHLRQDFEEMATGSPPSGVTVGLAGGGPLPRWVVLKDPSAPAGPRVLAEISRDRTETRFPHAGHIGLWTKADSLTHFDALEAGALG
jgi:hypothetical protein